MKRKAPTTEENGRLSPPPLKKKVESGTTSKAVANFFKPASQKEKISEQFKWRIVNNSLLVGKYHKTTSDIQPEAKRRKIAAFDFDSTLITTSSGNVFGRDAGDWKWWHSNVPVKLSLLDAEGYRVIVVSNQSGISLNPKNDSKPTTKEPKRLADFKTKASYVFGQLDIPISVYAATTKDIYRKPMVGMWKEMLEDHDLDEGEGPDLEGSFFVGDAAGRDARKGVKADHSCSDRDFAANVGIKFYTPEELFWGEEPLPFSRSFDPLLYIDQAESTVTGQGPATTGTPVIEKLNAVDLVLVVGSPGSGKSTFYWDFLQPLGYERVNQDILKTRDRCLKVAGEHLAAGKSVAVDNTNADGSTRAHWIALARTHNIPIRCVLLETPPAVCRHNDAVRSMNAETGFNPEKRQGLPIMAFTGYQSRYQEPDAEAEGFQDLIKVPFKFRGKPEGERWDVWKRYWN